MTSYQIQSKGASFRCNRKFAYARPVNCPRSLRCAINGLTPSLGTYWPSLRVSPQSAGLRLVTSNNRRFGWTTVLGLAVTIPLLWWALHDVHFSEVWSEFLGADKIPLLATMLAVSLSIPVRAARWRILMQSKGKKLPLAPLYHATAAGFAINNLLPARTGEVARAYAARRLTGITFSVAMSTVVI